MAAANLRLYDVIVDLVPGVVAVVLVLALVFSSWNQIGAFGGVSLLFVAYAVGRLFHALGSTSPIEQLRNWMESKVLNGFLTKRKHGLSFEHRLHATLQTAASSEGEDSSPPPPPREFSNAERRVHENTVRKLEETLKAPTSVRSGDAPIPDDSPVPKEPRYLRYLGENYLYGKDTLYRKYEMLTTFYRSLWLIFFLGAVTYGAVVVASGIGYVISDSSGALAFVRIQSTRICIVIGTALTAYIALRQRVKYEYKKHRAFIHDLYIELDREN